MDTGTDGTNSRRTELEELVPGTGLGAQIDRGAWMALSQGAPGTWSWPRAAATFALAAVLVAILYVAVDSSIDWVIGIAIAYGLLLWRARSVHVEYLRRTAS
jgi:CHASE2 domain-containing sensor protein